MAGEKDNRKRIPIIQDNGETWNLHSSASNDDWIRAGRLLRAARAGDEEARKKFEELDSILKLNLVSYYILFLL